MRLLRLSAPLLLLTAVCAPAPQPAPVAAPAVTKAAAPAHTNPNQAINDRLAKQISERIAGHEKEPAGQVFKNIQIPWLKTATAGQFVSIMNFGYSRALGVACTHCHDETDFSSDVKREKRAAREMAEMHHAINQQLAKMQNIEGAPSDRFVNCTTCHRGAVDPHKAD